MSLEICQRCKRPFMASEESCPHCPAPYKWNQESWANLGCLMMMILPMIAMIFFWFFMFLGFFIR